MGSKLYNTEKRRFVCTMCVIGGRGAGKGTVMEKDLQILGDVLSKKNQTHSSLLQRVEMVSKIKSCRKVNLDQ